MLVAFLPIVQFDILGDWWTIEHLVIGPSSSPRLMHEKDPALSWMMSEYRGFDFDSGDDTGATMTVGKETLYL